MKNKITFDYWNYRVIKRLTGGDPVYAIHEVYYKKNKPTFVTTEPVCPLGNSLKGLKEDFKFYVEEFKRPTLNYEDF